MCSQRRHKHRIRAVDVWLATFQPVDLRQIVDHDVRTAWVSREIVLVIVFGRIERLVRLNASDDRRLEDGRLLELVDVGFRDTPLLESCRKDRRPVLSAHVRSLSVEFGRIVCHREVNLQQAAVTDQLGIKADLD